MPRVVIFDDDENEINNLKLLLEEYGYDVTYASGADFLDGKKPEKPRQVQIVRSLEKQLEENVNLIRSMIDSLPVLTSYIDNTLRYRLANSYYEEIMDLEAAEIIGRPLYDVLGEEYFRKVLPHIEAVLAGEKQVFDTSLRVHNGEIHHFQVHYIPRWAGEKVEGFYALGYDISITKKLEISKKDSEIRLRSLVEHSTDNILMLDTELNIIYVNYALPGLTIDNLLGTPIYYNYPDEKEQELVRGVLRQVLANGEPASFETRYDAPDGTVVYYESNAVPQLRDGEIVGITLTSRDITAHKRIEKELEENIRRYLNVVANLPGQTVFLFDKDLRFILAEGKTLKEACSSFGINSREIEGKSIKEVFPPQLFDIFDTPFREAFKGKTSEAEFQYQGIIHSIQVQPVKDENDFIYAGLMVCREPSERKKLEKARESLLRLNHLMPDKSISEILAMGLEEAVKLTGSSIGYLHFYHPETETISLQMWSQETFKWCSAPDGDRMYPLKKAGVWADCIRDKKTVIHNDYHSLAGKKGLPDGHVEVTREIGVPVLENGEVTAVIGVGNKETDYTDIDADLLYMLAENTWSIVRKKKAQEELQALNKTLEERVKQRTAQLESANKELESFAYMVSHDLRAPLRHIAGFINLLQKLPVFESDEKSRRYMDIIEEASKSMGRLIDHLLTFSRMGRTHMRLEEIDSNHLVYETVKQHQTHVDDRKINWQIHDLPPVTGDRFMIAQAWDNLVSNAVKYTGKKEEAVIEIGVLQDHDPAQKDDTVPVFFIKDNGTGFDMTYVHKLFGVFQRLHKEEEFEGSGIGLAIVLRILQRHNGRIWAEAEPGKGAAFYFTIPGDHDQIHEQAPEENTHGG